ncbi:MAG: hypothetical protein WB239_16920 [Acidimicrobiia bacterium]
MILVVGAAVVVAGVIGGVVWANSGGGPVLRLSQQFPPEAMTIIEDSWSDFVAAFPNQRGCLGDVDLVAVSDLPDGDASYDFADHLIRVLVPSSPRRFPESLVHEFGHHLEASCPVVDEIGARFMALQGFPPDQDWYRGEVWFSTPSEHFAETVVQVVRGERLIHARDIALSSAAVDLVRQWGGTPAND